MTTPPTTSRVQLIAEGGSPYEELVPGREVTSDVDEIPNTDLGGGYFRQTRADAEYTCNVLGDEVLFVRDGKLEVESDSGEKVTAQAGEAIFIAKGTRATFRGELGTRTFWTISPAVYE